MQPQYGIYLRNVLLTTPFSSRDIATKWAIGYNKINAGSTWGGAEVRAIG